MEQTDTSLYNLKRTMYYIYHIPGVKIGCTELEPIKRINQQGYEEFEILEIHEDGWYAGDRELILQAEYGYTVDRTHYMKIRQNQNKNTRQSFIKRSNTSKGRIVSEETKRRMSIPKPKLECPYCGQLIGGTANLNQHINNKHKKRAL